MLNKKKSDENKQSAEPSALEKTQGEIEVQELQQKLLSFQLPGMPPVLPPPPVKSAGVPLPKLHLAKKR